jgi:hypothetical protein
MPDDTTSRRYAESRTRGYNVRINLPQATQARDAHDARAARVKQLQRRDPS